MKVPVMVAPYVPRVAEENVQDAVDVPPDESVTLDGHVPVSAGGVEKLRLMGPDSPNRLVMVRSLVPDEPAADETDDAEILWIGQWRDRSTAGTNEHLC